METVGKILSITLLTIFGSAAATVYMVDSNFLTSFLGSAPVTYSSDTGDTRLYEDSPDASKYRERQKTKYVEVYRQHDRTDYDNEDSTIWGQNYNTNPSPSEYSDRRAAKLAEENSPESLAENMSYWNEQYKKEVKSGNSRSANLAYKNYLEYKRALEIKQASGR